ncbi:prephenate dehydrogenase [Treponema sp. Marseille-Q4130]|uniref:prephenate dehydrogenase n=1 Tax=Treponema sp. Marseille-Q4130 TaxID=2766702 RepID=UPI0016523C7A|nr:prephenate dehydrogenase [Treponema sp. Marseille-Q4130]MBC6720632.1 prephenate dehydrogenase [Treponema sp. Marseille-Q4130]
MNVMNNLQDAVYGIVGLGIMGGSIAKAIRANVLDMPEARGKIFACDSLPATLDAAVRDGVIDKGFAPSDAGAMLSECDIVYICLYPHATLEFIKTHRNDFKSASIVTDISGIKTFLADGLADFSRADVDCIFGHPMAGGEKEGYVNSNGAYFKGRNYILMLRPSNKVENVELIKSLIAAMGFTRIVETDCKTHDRKIAFTSQLCHVIASALVKSAEDETITEFGGGSFEDLTRIAMINAPLWTELFLANKDELLSHIAAFEKQLAFMKKAVAENDAASLEAYLADVRTRRMNMGTFVVKTSTVPNG